MESTSQRLRKFIVSFSLGASFIKQDQVEFEDLSRVLVAEELAKHFQFRGQGDKDVRWLLFIFDDWRSFL